MGRLPKEWAEGTLLRRQGSSLGVAQMLESVDPNTMDAGAEPLLPRAGMKSNKPPLPPLRLPSLKDEPRPPAVPATLPHAGLIEQEPTGIEDEERRPAHEFAVSDTVAAVDATTTTRRLTGLFEFLGQDARQGDLKTILPGAGDCSPQSEHVGRGTAAQLISCAEEQRAALRRHGDRVRALQLARRAVMALSALQSLRHNINNGDVFEAVDTLEAAVTADRARWFTLQNITAAHERLSSSLTAELGVSNVQQVSSTAQLQCATLLQDAAAALRARLKEQLKRQADAQPTSAPHTRELIGLISRFNVVLLSMGALNGTRRVFPIDVEADVAIAHLRSAQIVAAAMTSTGAVGLGPQQLGGFRSASAAVALRCDAEAIFSDHLYAISAELAPPRPPIGPSGIAPSNAAPLPTSFEAPVSWHLSKVGSGVVGILQGLRVRCETVEATAPDPGLAASTVAQIAEIAGVAVCLFHSWAAQVFQRERCSLLELCTLHSDSLAVSNALTSLRSLPLLAASDGGNPKAGVEAMDLTTKDAEVDDKGENNVALDAAIARLAALQHAIGNHLSDGLEESAASFWELLPDKYWSPSSEKTSGHRRAKTRDQAGASPRQGGSGSGSPGVVAAGEYMRRLVEDLIAPGTKALLKLDPISAQELLPRIISGSLESLAAYLLKERPRFNEAGARRLRVDVGYLEAWVRRKLGDDGDDEDVGEAQQLATAGGTTGLAEKLLALPTFQRLRGAAALMADPEDRVARGQLSAADVQGWLALRKRRLRMGCGSAIC